MPFFNPYHFVPVGGCREGDLTRQQVAGGDSGAVTHSRYEPGTHSGRVICTATTETPMFIGAQRTDAQGGRPALSEPFQLDGQPAIPASSLRGLISSIAEAASNSAMRILENRFLSYRKPMSGGLSAIGLVTTRPDREGLFLVPLVAPNLEIQGPHAVLDRNYYGLFPSYAILKVYIGDRATVADPVRFPYRTAVWAGQGFDRYYAMKFAAGVVRPWDSTYRIRVDDDCIVRGGRVVAQKSVSPEPIPWQEVEQLPPGDQQGYALGVVRVLGRWDQRFMPENKEHELFIPYTSGVDYQAVPIPHEVVERFEALARERTEDSDRHGGPALPYEPKDTRDRSRNSPDHELRLREGDLVYFGAEHGGITEVSFSSIWRGAARARVYEFFGRTDPEVVPFHPGRQWVTTAEQVFGFVEELERGADRPALALAGRVRFSHALFSHVEDGGDPLERDRVTLKILGSPKPPCPAMYFKNRGRDAPGHISKATLDANSHLPQGRKFYLHERQTQINSLCWATAHRNSDLNMKTSVRPVSRGAVFVFHIDFDNLGDRELAMLLYALRPRPEYRHKIGMGKAIGLGAIRIDVAGLFLVDRQSRYSAEGALFEPRYHRAWLPAQLPASVRDRYSVELADARVAAPLDANQLRTAFTPPPEIAWALELIGDPASTARFDVHTPLRSGQPAEQRTFEWFVENDRRGRQYLRPIGRGQAFPELE